MYHSLSHIPVGKTKPLPRHNLGQGLHLRMDYKSSNTIKHGKKQEQLQEQEQLQKQEQEQLQEQEQRLQRPQLHLWHLPHPPHLLRTSVASFIFSLSQRCIRSPFISEAFNFFSSFLNSSIRFHLRHFMELL